MSQNSDPNDIIIPTEIDPQDIDQEVELLKLEGIQNPSRYLIERKMRNHQPLLFGIISDAFLDEPLPWQTRSITPIETITNLTEWAMSQSARIQDLIFEFLDQPDEEDLESVLKVLEVEGIEISRSISQPKEAPLWKYLLDEITNHPYTSLDHLYRVGRNLAPFSRRPEAAVRQAVRRLLKTGLIIMEEPNVYCLSR